MLGRLYGKFYDAFNTNNVGALEEIARQILRVNGSMDNLLRSIKNKDEQYGRAGVRTPEQLAAIEEAFNNP